MKKQKKVVEYNLRVSEFNWDLAPGKTIEAWGFNEQVPGPVLKANVGDTLVIRITNNLKEPTMIHWHGLRIPAPMDGTGAVQKPIEPGKVFEYRFVLPDAGTFWYHSHFNETIQLERGMYGALIVDDDTDPVTDGEKVFMIDDMKLDADNQFTKPGWVIPRIIEKHDGREGNTLLQIWEVSNTSMMDHPFHLHGFFFQVIEENGKPPDYMAWKDTVNLTPRSKIKIAWMPDNRPGTWMYHCHILEHHAAGMMANFEVIDGNKPYDGMMPDHTHHHH
jgi:FtsP/CotA-like multicopper oxidase with cupredoxin domain